MIEDADSPASQTDSAKKPMQRLGFLAGQFAVPDDLNQMAYDFDQTDSEGSGVLCVLTLVGNIVGERSYGLDGHEYKNGIRKFSAGTKIYLSQPTRWWLLKTPNDEKARKQHVCVLGLNRHSRRLIQCYVRLEYVVNWRVQVVYEPKIVARLKQEAWNGFLLNNESFRLGEDRTSQKVIDQFLDALFINQQTTNY